MNVRPGVRVISTSHPAPSGDRLDSWKEIAAYLKRGARTVQRWERGEGLPVHRLQHDKLGSVYAYRAELDAWWSSRGAELDRAEGMEPSGAAIAVLPFADMSQEKDQAYFCAGMAEEILSALSRIGGLRVASRASSFQFRPDGADPREIGRKLRVGTLLEGSVRRAGERLRISVQLTDAETGFQRWSARYDREMKDIFALQDEISESVARELELALGRQAQPARKPPTQDLRAYDFYLRGRAYYYQYSPKGVEYALQMFLRALEADPAYAQAYAGLADCWSYVYLYSDRSDAVKEQADWASARAVELDPDSASAQASRGLSLSIAGQDDAAEQAFERASRLDPGLFEAYYFHARHAFTRGRAEEAVRLYEQAMRANPDDYQAPLLAAQVYDDLGRRAEAAAARRTGIAIAQARFKLNPDDARALYMTANGLAALGQNEKARQAAARALAIRPEDPMLLYNVGCIFSLLGLMEAALDCLEKAAASGLAQKAWYERDSNLDALRGLARFQRILDHLA